MKASAQKEDNDASIDNVSQKSANSKKNSKISLTRNIMTQPVGTAGVKQNDVLIKEALQAKYPEEFDELDFKTTTDVVAEKLFKVLE